MGLLVGKLVKINACSVAILDSVIAIGSTAEKADEQGITVEELTKTYSLFMQTVIENLA